MREIKNVKELKIGGIYRYKGQGNVRDEQEYTAVITHMTQRLICMSVIVDPETMIDTPFDYPLAHGRDIQIKELGRSQHLYSE